MDDITRLQRRRSLPTAYSYAVPTGLIAFMAWDGWGRISFTSLREALTLWPAIALIAGIVAAILLQPLARAPRYVFPGLSFYLVAAAACWLVAWTQPAAGIYMSAALAGTWVASRLHLSAKSDTSSTAGRARAND